jgi:predicted flap endonuclease-1-like 5' DNA nuclease
MSGNFNPNKSRITDDQMMAWVEKEVTGNLDEVPGLGEKSVTKMGAAGIVTTWQLFGKFLLLREADMSPVDHCDAFWSFLEECDTPSGYRSGVVLAVQEKLSGGMRLPVGSDEIAEPTDGGYDPKKSTVTNDTLMEFVDDDLSDDVTEVPGIGEKSAQNLAGEGINTTFQLFGKFLMAKDDDTSFQEMCDQFYSFLKEVKTSPGHRAGVIQCMSEKLAVGIKIPVPTIAEGGGGDGSDGDGNDSGADEVEVEEKREDSKGTVIKAEGGSNMMPIMAVIIAIILFFVLNQGGKEVALAE